MKKNLLSTAVAATLGLLVLAPAAQASDGTIEFTGFVTASTCVISNQGGPSFTVALPRVAATSLATPGTSAGRTPFWIRLTGCTTGPGMPTSVRAYFEPGVYTNAAGRLNLKTVAAVPASGTAPAIPANATNVDLELLANDFLPIFVGGPSTLQGGGTPATTQLATNPPVVSASAIEISSASRTLTRGWSWFRWEPAVDNYRLDASVGPPFLEPIVGIPEPSGEAPSSATSLT